MVLFSPDLADPWRLGRGWRWLPWGLVAIVWASLAGSEVPRAGLVGAVLVPAFVLAPSAFARFLGTERSRRRELCGIAVVVAAVAGWALVQFAVEGTPRPARPLGHHNYLATFLVLLLPLALVPTRESGIGCWLGGGAGLLGIAALVATRSLSGGLALVGEGVVFLALRTQGRLRRSSLAAAAVVAVGLLAYSGSRVRDIVTGTDLSAQARAVYLDAGLRGLAAAPWLGHGPGSTPWTIAAFTRPVPGVTPPGEALGELHSLPLAIGYEAGVVGLAAAGLAFAVFSLRRGREARGPAAADRALGAAGLIALLGGLVAGLGTAEWRVTALPLAGMVAMGAGLAGGFPWDRRAPARRGATGEKSPSWSSAIPGAIYLVAAAFVLTPKLRAQFLYEQAVESGDPLALEAAARLDPTFPLYRARLAWGGGDAAEALAAARLGAAVPSLWAAAAELGSSAEAPWAISAAMVTCRLDPLLPVGPWLALAADPDGPDAPRWAAHALAADPRLGAAELWRAHSGLLERAVAILEQDPGLDRGWRRTAVETLRPGGLADGGTARLGLGFDDDPARSVSLVTFRRRPSPWLLAPVRVHAVMAERLASTLPSAALLVTTSPQVVVFSCGPDGAPQELWKTLRKTR